MARLRMQTNGDLSQIYARAFSVRSRLIAFRAELDDIPSWKLASNLLFRRFEMAFGFFLDAPTPNRLATVVAFEAEMEQIAGRLAGLPPWRQLRRPPQ